MITIFKKAVIYARVSSPKQVKQGHGLDAQEMRCREYARGRGYDVITVFKDEGVSGSLKDRPNITAMIKYLKQNKKYGPFVVIIDEISRLARDVRAHLDLKDAIMDAGAKIESPGVEFGNDANGILFEQTQAVFAEHYRRKNREQVVSRMEARVHNGYYVFAPVPGYVFETVAGHGKMLVKEPHDAPIVQEALEGFASGRFQTITEVKRFFDCHVLNFVKTKSGKARPQQVKEILQRPLYAGYITIEKWGLHMHPGKHEPLISLATWNKVQERLKGVCYAPARKDIREDFPLRGFVTCAECDKPLCAGWSTGRSAKYPYYTCLNKPCSHYGKSIKRAEIEGEFAELLHTMQPTPKLVDLCRDIFRSLWKEREKQSGVTQAGWKAEIAAKSKKIDQLMDRIIACESASLISAYETKIKELEIARLELEEKAAKTHKNHQHPNDVFRTALSFLENPCKLWLSDVLEYKRLVLRLIFTAPLAYARNEGFRTASIARPIWLLGQFGEGEFGVVGPEGLEPPTNPL